MELTVPEFGLVAVLFFIIAALYASVGHGGASGYLAILSFFLLPPSLMSTTALLLNVLVAGLGTILFIRAGHFSPRLAWPFVLLSIPAAFIGGFLQIADAVYYLFLASVLLFASYRLYPFRKSDGGAEKAISPSLPVMLGSGAGIGLLSGIVGVGGGIFLSPIMILLRWATVKQTAAVSAFFIVVNSLAGLGGRVVRGSFETGTIWPFVLAAFFGGLAGSYAGSKVLGGRVLRKILSLVLLIAALKLILATV